MLAVMETFGIWDYSKIRTEQGFGFESKQYIERERTERPTSSLLTSTIVESMFSNNSRSLFLSFDCNCITSWA